MLENIRKPLGFSKTVGAPGQAARQERSPGRELRGRPRVVPESGFRTLAGGIDEPDVLAGLGTGDDESPQLDGARLEALVREWLLDLRVLGRSERTIRWYQQKMDWFLRNSEVRTLGHLTVLELKRHLAGLQERGLAPNTIHGFFETIKAFANWADREGYEVDHGLLRARGPKVPQKEMETYTEAQLQAIMAAAPAGWPQMAILVLLGTGMRVSELCGLTLEDIEDDGEATFLKIKLGKGAKFRRAPVSRRLRRELVKYVNRVRPESRAPELLVRPDGMPVRVETVTNLFQGIRRKVGFRVHAHRFRHTFATQYLRQGGEIERLRRILGHTSYVMVMRYVHLDKGDLYQDFDLRSPF